MNFTLVCRIATSARTKLVEEANRQDRDLRLLVAHANLLDATMYRLEFASSELSKSSHSVNRNLNSSHHTHSKQRQIKWMDEVEDENSDIESHVESVMEEEMSSNFTIDHEDIGDIYEVDRGDLALIRVPTRR